MNERMNFHWRRDFENIDVLSINRFAAHTRYGAYSSEADAAAYAPNTSKNILSLNGTHRFLLYPNPESVERFYEPGFEASHFQPITVPGNWEVQGFGEPLYTNYVYPWADDPNGRYTIAPHSKDDRNVPNPPHIPGDNPTGCYLYSFDLPSGFDEKALFLRFDGVETAFYCWINGEPVGYSQDSKLPCEFSVTDHLKPGRNTLAVQVMRFADSIYLEDQDYWHLSGIYRGVWLIAKPKAHLTDFRVKALPDLLGGGSVEADASISRIAGFADYTMHVALYDGDAVIAQGEGGFSARAEYRDDVRPTAGTARVRMNLSKVALWSPESAKLYTAVFVLIDPAGNKVDFESCRVGFKKIEVKQGVVHLNGKRLVVHGVNRHDHSWREGRAVPRAHMIEEIRQMKRMNINSVRTCHYPDTPEWYDLCDELGILLICECNVETHGVMGQLTHDPAWAMSFVERAMRMVLHYKNHASIYSWSLGNESGTGPNHAAMYGFIKAYDDTRLCQYEAGFPGKNVSDVRGWMYAEVQDILSMLCDPADDRPIILVEYLYQIMNSGGGLDKFIELVDRYPRFQGGYVWDWQDKCLVGHTENGQEYFAYGGDFGESYTDPEVPLYMTCNGIVLPDLTWKPVAHHLRMAYAPLRIEPVKSHRGDIGPLSDRYVLKNLRIDDVHAYAACTARLREDGAVVCERPLDLPVVPQGGQEEFRFAFEYDFKPGKEYAMDFAFAHKETTFFAEAGEEIAAFQYELVAGVKPFEKVSTEQPIEVKVDSGKILIGSGAFALILDEETGALLSYEKDGVRYLEGGVTPCVDRPYTGLDCQSGWGHYDRFLPIRTSKLIWDRPTVLAIGDRAHVECEFRFEGDCPLSGILYLDAYSDGTLDVDFSIEKNPSTVQTFLRAGVELAVPEGFEGLRYYGRGGVENYADRKQGSPLGIHQSSVEAEHFPFIPPCENGGHEDTRWLELENAQGRILRIEVERPVHFDVHHNTVDDYKNARHEHALIRRKESYLHIDAAQLVIGSDMAWSTVLDEAHWFSDPVYRLRMRVGTR